MSRHRTEADAVHLVAYAATGSARLDPTELRGFLAMRLPAALVPPELVLLEALPTTPNGKIDRTVLPTLRTADRGEQAAPVGELERRLAKVWADILGTPPHELGRHDGFFDLGGHSLAAMRLAARLREIWGVDADARLVFEAPTITAQAQLIGGQPGEPAPDPDAERPPHHRPGEPRHPLSFGQQRLWLFEQVRPGTTAYVINAVIRVAEPLDELRLENVLHEVVRRHDSLRTRFDVADGVPYQWIDSRPRVPLAVHDLREESPERAATAARAVIERAADVPISLRDGPLLRVDLVRVGVDRSWLSLTTHHVVCDGWSLALLLDELATAYRRTSTPDAAAPPPLEVQFGDYARWQRKRLTGQALDRLLGFWRQQLADAPVGPLIPADVRGARRTYTAASVDFAVSAELTRRFRIICRHYDVTLYMLLLAGFVALLGRRSGSSDVVVGTPIAERDLRQAESLIGFLVNTVVLRVRVDLRDSLRDLVAEVRRTSLDAFAHKDLPYERLVEELGLSGAAESALFQAMFALQNTGPRNSSGNCLGPYEVNSGTGGVDLVMSMEEVDGHLSGRLEYDAGLFRQESMQALVELYREILATLAAAPDAAVGDLPAVQRSEWHGLVHESNDTSASYPHDRCIHHLIEQRARSAGDSVALICGDRCLTYAELNARADALSRRLLARGAGPDRLIAVCLEGFDLIIALLAILKAGAAYLPVDPGQPAVRVRETLEQARPILMIGNGVADVDVLTADGEVAHETGARSGPPPTVDPDHLAYTLFTSGSTGRPKGVMISHRALCAEVTWRNEYLRLTADDVVLQGFSPGFDPAVWEMFGPLVAGARLVLLPTAGRDDPRAVTDVLRAAGVTVMQAVPSRLRLLLATGALAATRSLRCLVIGGEALPAKLVAELRAVVPAEVYNLYGPTEACIDATAFRMPESGPGDRDAVPIGRPVANTAIHLLDQAGCPVPAGAVGELYIGGVGLARGYLYRPDLTADRFVPDPVADTPGARLYRTGDLGRRLPNGTVEFVGRRDDQVKFRGYRIELGEIASVLTGHPSVRQAVVLLREAAGGGRDLVAFLVGDDVGVGELREYLRSRLPHYMVPTAYVVLAAFPLLPSGKVDRRMLPALERSTAEARTPPSSPTQRRLAAIWAELLGVPAQRIGVDDGFFDLGGHSLLAARLTARITESFGVEVPLGQVFDRPTLAGLADVVEKRVADLIDGLSDAETERWLRQLQTTIDGKDAP